MEKIEKQKKPKLNKGHWLEITDRTHVILSNIENHIASHPTVSSDPAMEKQVKKAQKALMKLYTLVGSNL